MSSFEEAPDATVTPALVEDEHIWLHDAGTHPAEPITVQESPTSAVARMLELAAGTAEQLVADAEREADSLVTTARARADAILEASRREADQVAAELARSKEQQTAELDRERATAMAGLADEQAALEAQTVTLRQLLSDHRSQIRRHLTEQLALLDATEHEPPAAVAG